MAKATPTTRFRFWLWLIRVIGVLVPRQLRADWRQEWQAELRYREALLAEWDRLNWHSKLDLLRRSLGAFWDALWLQAYRWEDAMIQDLRYGVRMLVKSPGFTFVMVLTLALGIGANTAIFSVINTLLLRSLPVKAPDELVLAAMVVRTGHDVYGRPGHYHTFSYPLYEQLRDGSRSLTGLFAAGGVGRHRMIAPEMAGPETEFIRAQPVSGNFFSVLGVSAALGRTLTPEDDQAAAPQAVAVLSHSFWQRRFGGDPSVVGKRIVFDDVPFTIAGVGPPGFFGFEVGANPDLWWPMQMIPQVVRGPSGQRLKQQGSYWLRIMGRMRAGVERSQAQAELDVIFQQYLADFAATRAANWDAGERRFFTERNLELLPGGAGWTNLRQQFGRQLLILMVVVGLVLLIACANVASLLLARAAARTREFTVRHALGAGRFRLIRQLLTESVLLAALGGLLGILLAHWGTHTLLSFMRLQNDPVSFDVSPDARVLGFTTAVSLLTGLLFGLAPALRMSRFNLAAALKETSGGVAGHRFSHLLNKALVVAQVALSVVLLIGAGLFVRTLEQLKGLDAGFNRQNVILFDLDFTGRLDPARRAALYKELLERLEPLPGVQAACISTFYLLSGGGWSQKVSAEGQVPNDGEDLTCHGMVVGPKYFETMGIPFLSGRDFGPVDERPAGQTPASAPRTAVINEAMARRYFGQADPLGKRFHFTGSPEQMFEIVGVVKNAKYLSLRQPPPPTYYIPFFQAPGDQGMTFALRTGNDPGALLGSIASMVREVDPTVRARNLRTLDDVVDASLHQERVVAQLGGFFSLFALTLACLGLYGVLSFAVVQRTREMGVRMALGAQRRDVLSLVVGQGLKLALLGSLLGLLVALAVTRVVSSLLYGVTATDPLTFTGVSLLVLLVALLASWLPARRATRVDPLVALRHE